MNIAEEMPKIEVASADVTESYPHDPNVNEDRQVETESSKLGQDDPVTISDALKKYVGPSMNWVDMMAEEDRQEKINDEKIREERQKALMTAVESLKEPFIVYISNMAQQTLGEDIFYFFGGAEAVVEYYFYTPEGNHMPSGDGLVELMNKESLVKALLTNNRELFRKKICVEYVDPYSSRCIAPDDLPGFAKKMSLNSSRPVRPHPSVVKERREQNQSAQRRGHTDNQSHAFKQISTPLQPLISSSANTSENVPDKTSTSDMVTIRQPRTYVRDTRIFGDTKPGRDLFNAFLEKKTCVQPPVPVQVDEAANVALEIVKEARQPPTEPEPKPASVPMATIGRSGSTASANNSEGFPAGRKVYANSSRGPRKELAKRPVPDISKLTKHLPKAAIVRSDDSHTATSNNRGVRMAKSFSSREKIRQKSSVDSTHSSVTASSAAAPTVEDAPPLRTIPVSPESTPPAQSESENTAAPTESATSQTSTSRTKKSKANKKKKGANTTVTTRTKFSLLPDITA